MAKKEKVKRCGYKKIHWPCAYLSKADIKPGIALTPNIFLIKESTRKQCVKNDLCLFPRFPLKTGQ